MSNPFNSDFDAFLFDMDGTILNSIAVAERVWGAWAWKFGLNPEDFLPTIHGRRAHETIAALELTGVDAHAEAAAITRAEVADVQGVQPIAGAEAFLSALPQNRWAVVTSAPLALATRRLEAAGLPRPSILITAEDVRNGKPAPDCFILAAERLSVSPSRCLAFEDADAGIRAATAAGCEVLVITETHRHKMPSPYAQVENYKGLQPQLGSGRLKLASK